MLSIVATMSTNYTSDIRHSPVEPILKRFQNDWDQLDHEATDLQFFDWEESPALVEN